MKASVDPRLAWLRKVSEDPSYYNNLPARLAYLEFCYDHDSISSDTRSGLHDQIEELRKRIKDEADAEQK